MKICLTCGSKQEKGNFCEKCGGQMDNVELEQAATVADTLDQEESIKYESNNSSSLQNSEQLENIKKHSKMYATYFIEQLKTPTVHYQVNTAWKNSLANIVLYIILTAISVYFLIRSMVGGFFGGFDSYAAPSFIKIMFYFSIFIVLLISINMLAVFITSKLFSEEIGFAKVVHKIGNYYTLPIIFSVLGIVLVIIKSFTYSTLIINIGFIMAIFIIPFFVMVKLLSNKSKGIDSFYALLFYLVVTGVLSYIVFSFIIDSAIGNYLNYLL